MSRRRLAIVHFAVCLALAAPLYAQTFDAVISEDQVVGGTGSVATGSATLVLNAAQDALTYTITLNGLDLDGLQTPADMSDDVTNLHIHIAPPGMNGPIAFGIIAPGDDGDDLVIDPVAGTVSGIWEETDVLFFGSSLSAELGNLFGGNLYINVHTTSFPGGEIRGQIIPPPLVEIPTLGATGFAVLILALLSAGIFVLWRRRAA